MIIGNFKLKIKKLFIWFFIAILFCGGVLGVISAKAAKPAPVGRSAGAPTDTAEFRQTCFNNATEITSDNPASSWLEMTVTKKSGNTLTTKIEVHNEMFEKYKTDSIVSWTRTNSVKQIDGGVQKWYFPTADSTIEDITVDSDKTAKFQGFINFCWMTEEVGYISGPGIPMTTKHYYKLTDYKTNPLKLTNTASGDPLVDDTEETPVDDSDELSDPVDEGTCGVKFNIAHPINSAVWRSITKVLCVVLYGMADAAKWLIDNIFGTVFNAYIQPINNRLGQAISHTSNLMLVQKAIAASPSPAATPKDPGSPDESSIKAALNGTPDWVIRSWKIMLGLADVFVVVILLFLAITNIMHIQYDTYAIKKALPTLIIGIILANFSVFITKMFVDFANILTATFMGATPGDSVNELITAIIPNKTGTFLTTDSMLSIIVAIFFAFFAVIAFMILGFLFYIRYAVILALTVVAPLAFVLMAFPPTAGIFKQWWGWYAKFIFMKPLSLFFIWMATEVLRSSGGKAGITVWAVAVFCVCAAIIVPFKLGGAVMGAWGKAGKWASGTNKEGWLRKPVDKYVDRKKGLAKMAINDRFRQTRLGQAIDRGAQGDELSKARYEQREKTRNATRAEEVKTARGGTYDREMSEQEFLQSSIERRIKTNKDTRVEEIYRDGAGLTTDTGAITEQQLSDDEYFARRSEKGLESVKRRRLYDMARSDRGYELGVFENEILTTEKALTKVQENKAFIIAGERVRRAKAIPPGLSNALQERDRAQDAISNTAEGTAERTNAEAALATAQAEIATQTAALQTGPGALTTAQIQEHLDSHMTNVEFTRQFSIMNPRVQEDARTNIKNRTANQSADHVLGVGGGFTEGPNAAEADDGRRFLTGQATSSAGATEAVYTRMQEINLQMSDTATAADGVRAYVRTLNGAGGTAQIELNAGTQNVLQNTSDDVRTEVLNAVNAGLPPGTAPLTDASQITGAHLETARFTPGSTFEHRDFINSLNKEMLSRDSATFRSGLSGNIGGYL